MRENRLLLGIAVVALLGCGSEPSHADDQKPDDKKPPAEQRDDKKDEKPASAEKKKDEKKLVYRAHIVDRVTDIPPYDIEDAWIRVPFTSIHGGSDFEKKQELNVKPGAAEIQIPFAEIAQVECKEAKDDRL